jgi:hypothetical protein
VEAARLCARATQLDPYLNSVQWSRRFLGLRLFLSLAAAGVSHGAYGTQAGSQFQPRTVAELDFAGLEPMATNIVNIVESADPVETYHITWSPDMKYITFTKGPKFGLKSLKGLLPEFPGVDAPGWNVCVAVWRKRFRSARQ